MAFLAVDIDMVFVQHLPGHAVIEHRWAPVTVAAVAVAVELGEGYADVAAPATGGLVEPVQRPAGTAMVEPLGRGTVLSPMAAFASSGVPPRQIHVVLMTPDTRCMVLCDRMGSRLLGIFGVTPCTASFVVAIHALQAKAMYVVAVTEDHRPSGKPAGSGPIGVPIRFRDRRVHSPQKVVLGR